MSAAKKIKKREFHSLEEVVLYMREHLRFGKTEQAMVLYLHDATLIEHEVFEGTASTVLSQTQEITRKAVILGAGDVIHAHTHPSGSAVASLSDLSQAKALKTSLSSVGVDLVDDLILTEDRTYSVLNLATLEEMPLYSSHAGMEHTLYRVGKWVRDLEDVPIDIRLAAERMILVSEELAEQKSYAYLKSPLQAGS